MTTCKFCGESFQGNPHAEILCELIALRALRDRIRKWPSTPVDFKAEFVYSGRAELQAAITEIWAIVTRAQELAD